MRSVCIAVSLIAFSFFAKAQFPQDIAESFSAKPQFFFDFTGYTSFIKKDWANFTGIRFGLNYNEKVKVGLGVSYLNSPVVTPIHITEEDVSYTTNGKLRFTYAEASLEYIFYNEAAWQFSLPLTIGGGRAHYKYISRSKEELANSRSYAAWIFLPEVTAQYTVLNVAAATGSLGYLGTLHAPAQLKKSFNSITFSVGFTLFLDQIWKSVSQKK
jgi:hypothetical protein